MRYSDWEQRQMDIASGEDLDRRAIRRGEIIGKRVGAPVSEAEHCMQCRACGGYFDMRDLGAVCEHEGPLPHPATAEGRMEV